jgi:NitT/TauT family transport system substrate-binding protein
MAIRQTRRGFLTAMSAAGALRLFRVPRVLAAEGPLETTSVHLFKSSLICSAAPQYAAEELLRAEGFKEIAYVEVPRTEMLHAFSDGRVDFTVTFAVNHIQAIDHGAPITILAGVHAGCYELFAREGLGGITELMGLQVGSSALLKLMVAQVGLDPERDFQWVIDPKVKPRDQAGGVRNPRGHRSLRPRAGAGRATRCRSGPHREIRLPASGPERTALLQMAGVRRRGTRSGFMPCAFTKRV